MLYFFIIYWQALWIQYISVNLSFYSTTMANRIHIQSPQQLRWQQDGVFSVDGRKAKFIAYGNHQAIFAILFHGRLNYDKKTNEWVIAVDLSDINEDSNIYKLGSMK